MVSHFCQGQGPLSLEWVAGPCMAPPFSPNHLSPHITLLAVSQRDLCDSSFNRCFLVRNLPHVRKCSRPVRSHRAASCPHRAHIPGPECGALLTQVSVLPHRPHSSTPSSAPSHTLRSWCSSDHSFLRLRSPSSGSPSLTHPRHSRKDHESLRDSLRRQENSDIISNGNRPGKLSVVS